MAGPIQIPFNKNDMTFLGLNILGHDVIHDFGKADSDRWKKNKESIKLFLEQPLPLNMNGGGGDNEDTSMQVDTILPEFIDEDDTPVNADNYKYYINQFQHQTANIALLNCFDMYSKQDYKFIVNKEFNIYQLLFFCIQIFNPSFTVEEFNNYINFFFKGAPLNAENESIVINIYNELGYNFFIYLISKIPNTEILQYEIDFSFIFTYLKDYIISDGISLDLIDFMMNIYQGQQQLQQSVSYILENRLTRKQIQLQLQQLAQLLVQQPQYKQAPQLAQLLAQQQKQQLIQQLSQPLPQKMSTKRLIEEEEEEEVQRQAKRIRPWLTQQPTPILGYAGGNLAKYQSGGDDLTPLYRNFITDINNNIINVINTQQGSNPQQNIFIANLKSINDIALDVISGNIDKEVIRDNYNTSLNNIIDYFYSLCNAPPYQNQLGFKKFTNQDFFKKEIEFCAPNLNSRSTRNTKDIYQGLLNFTNIGIKKSFEAYINKQELAVQEQIKRDKANLLADASGNLTSQQKDVVNDFAAFIAKSALYVNNVADYNGNIITQFDKLPDSMLKTQIRILYNQAQKIDAWGQGIQALPGDLDENLLLASQKPGPGYALNPEKGPDVLKICTSSDRQAECRKYIINNAADLSKLQNTKKQKVFCPLTSIIDAQSNCSWNSSKKFGIEYDNMNFILYNPDTPNYFYQGSILGVNGLNIEAISPTNINVSINFSSNIFNFNETNSFQPSIDELDAANVLYNTLNKLYNNKFKNTVRPADFQGLPFSYIWDLGEDNVKNYLQTIYFILFKGVGDLFQEINAVAERGSYLNIPPKYLIAEDKKEIARITPNRLNTARLFLANDRPSAVRFGFILKRANSGVNQYAYGGFYTQDKQKTTIFSKSNIASICQKCAGEGVRGGNLKQKNKKYTSIKNRKYKNKKKNQTIKGHKKYSNSRKVFKSKTLKYKSLPKKRNNKSYKKKKYSLKRK